MFEQEMCNIEAYLAFEIQNFGKRLRVEYDIDFSACLKAKMLRQKSSTGGKPILWFLPCLLTFILRINYGGFNWCSNRNSAFCTNSEPIGILWEGNSDKSGCLRQLIMDMRECPKKIGAEDMVIKSMARLN
ncbi:MAG: hypothetical protein IJ192_07425 [Clostridia bacterium]|nr:hypothetical protein [Clostridia bacterium]